jgi:hypothetical protein
VAIELEAGLRSTCVLLTVKSSEGAVLRTSKGARTQGRMAVFAAVFRDDLPASVELEATGFSDLECTTATNPAERSAPVQAEFPALGVKDVTLTVKRTVTGVDVDNDGSPSEEDCDDRDARRRPGLAEDCTDGKDNDCNNFTDCGDGVCTGRQCRLAASICAASGLCTETNCANGADDDGDTSTDCQDADCDAKTCLNGGTCTARACANARSEAGLCADGQDNDNDGARDCLDSDCDNQPCSDGLACNAGETCRSQACGGGAAVMCAAPANVCLGTPGTCSEALDGGCSFPARSADAGCDDGVACTENDACDGDGGCIGTPKACTTPPDGGCWGFVGLCDEAQGGTCVYSIEVGRLSCSDSDGCTVNDACLADGGCLGQQLNCANAIPPNECQVPTGQCTQGACTFMPRTGSCAGGTCLNGDCVAPDGGAPDSGVSADAGSTDGGVDAGPMDAGVVDAGPGFLVPSNVPLSTISGAPAATLTFNCDSTITLNPIGYRDNIFCSEPTLPPAVLVPQVNGPTLVVFVVDRLVVNSGATVSILAGPNGADSAFVPVFAVRGDAIINGTIEVSARFDGFNATNGPGGSVPGCPANISGSSQSNRSGGGQGGAFGLPSGAGGRGDNGAAGAPSMAANGNDTLTPLRGGCPGSRGGGGASGRFGHNGGGLQLWARGQLSINGAVLANGGRGLGTQLVTGGGGGGGGSGGGLLIEATTLNLGASAIVAANGGSGAEGSSIGDGANGLPGAAGVDPVAGGNGPVICGGPGGRGGARNGDAGVGENGDPGGGNCTNLGGGGGGGGSVGRVRFNALNPCVITTGARVSPRSSSAQVSCQF